MEGYLEQFWKFCLRQQLFALKELCMEKRLPNIFKTTNVSNLTKVIQESSYRVLKVTSRLPFKGSWVLLYFWHSNWHYFGYISGKVGKPHFLENLQKSLKTRQHSYQLGHPLRNGPLEIWKIWVSFGGSFF